MQLDLYRSWVPWRDEFSGNLAVFCSDERFVAPTFEFLQRRLDMERCDLVVVAGGPAFIVQEEVALNERLELLLKAHGIKRVALISHEDCGYYKHRYQKLTRDELKEKQLDDLRNAVSMLRQRGLQVRAFFASVENGEVVFEEIGV